MSGCLLDTHTAIWFFSGNNRLSETVKNSILDLSKRKYVSIVSAWEIAIKIGLGKLGIDGRTADFIHDVEDNGFTVVMTRAKPGTVRGGLSNCASAPALGGIPFQND